MKNSKKNSSPRYPKRQQPPEWIYRSKQRSKYGCGCGTFSGVIIIIFILVVSYLLVPIRSNVTLIGLDFSLEGSAVARSDTIILTTFVPLKPYIGMLSVPRDLWVSVPGYGENRINTAHFFAEAEEPGTGPNLLAQTIYENFGIRSDYFIRIQFDGFRELINSIDGVDISLDKPAAGYLPGDYHLNGRKALAFIRNRSGTDDFFRMEQTQIIMRAMLEKVLKPQNWNKLPAFIIVFAKVTSSNLPWWQWPRLGLAILRAGSDGIEKKIIDRNMVSPYITSQGANVLLPNWSIINEVIREIFVSID